MAVMSESAPRRRPLDLNISWTDIGPFLALAALLVAGYLINPDFLSATNLANVITRSAFIAIIAVGATFVISSGGSIFPSARWPPSSPASPSCS